MTTFLSVVAALATGLFTGWLVATTCAQAKISRSQERMQRLVRHWQATAESSSAEVAYLRRNWPGADTQPLDTWGG